MTMATLVTARVKYKSDLCHGRAATNAQKGTHVPGGNSWRCRTFCKIGAVVLASLLLSVICVFDLSFSVSLSPRILVAPKGTCLLLIGEARGKMVASDSATRWRERWHCLCGNFFFFFFFFFEGKSVYRFSARGGAGM